MANIVLNFSEVRNTVSLDSVHFSHAQLPEPRFSYRGKGLSSLLCRHSFQWSPAVRALSILVLRTKCGSLTHGSWPTQDLPALVGAQGTPAASLDYALSKRPLWLLDMFGVTSGGEALASALFARWNPERKRGGEVVVSLHPHHLCPQDIEITRNGAPLAQRYLEAFSLRIDAQNFPRASSKHSLTREVLSLYSGPQMK